MRNKLLKNVATPNFRDCDIHKFLGKKVKNDLGENAIFDEKVRFLRIFRISELR